MKVLSDLRSTLSRPEQRQKTSEMKLGVKLFLGSGSDIFHQKTCHWSECNAPTCAISKYQNVLFNNKRKIHSCFSTKLAVEVVLCRLAVLWALVFLSTSYIFLPKFQISRSDFWHFKGIHNWIDSRVCVREHNANVDSCQRHQRDSAKVSNAVHNVEWQPGQSKQQ